MRANGATRLRRMRRRPPPVTTGTLPPEGSEAPVRGYRPVVREWPIAVVLAAVVTGLLVSRLVEYRSGLLVVGAALLGAAVLRWLVPEVGLLAVRSRFTDVLTLTVMGAGVVLLSLVLLPDPLLSVGPLQGRR